MARAPSPSPVLEFGRQLSNWWCFDKAIEDPPLGFGAIQLPEGDPIGRGGSFTRYSGDSPQGERRPPTRGVVSGRGFTPGAPSTAHPQWRPKGKTPVIARSRMGHSDLGERRTPCHRDLQRSTAALPMWAEAREPWM
jgi:hypothetical protein